MRFRLKANELNQPTQARRWLIRDSWQKILVKPLKIKFKYSPESFFDRGKVQTKYEWRSCGSKKSISWLSISRKATRSIARQQYTCPREVWEIVSLTGSTSLYVAPVVLKVDSPILWINLQWIVRLFSHIIIRWKVIYLMDSAIQHLNNRGLEWTISGWA